MADRSIIDGKYRAGSISVTASSSSVLIGEFACIDLKFKLYFQIQPKNLVFFSDFNLKHNKAYYFAYNTQPSCYVML